MRFATWRRPDGVVEIGVVGDATVHPIVGYPSMRSLVALGREAACAVGERALSRPGIPLDDVRLIAPIEPVSVRDCVAFEEHVEGVRRSIEGAPGVPAAWYDAPTFYFTNPHTLLGPDDVVPFPARSVDRDFELEVAVVVGEEGTSLSLAEAEDAVFGYVILNDWSARDLQRREMQVGLGPAKGKDFATSIGPWIVTPDELEHRRDADGFLDLACRVLVNDVPVGEDLLSNMGWSFATLIAYASRDSRVRPGDLIGSGTTGHGGCLAELWGLAGRQDPPPLRDGDVVRLEVEGLGSLTNTVGVRPTPPELPPFRTPSRRRPLHAAH